jgi:hypothetical protein
MANPRCPHCGGPTVKDGQSISTPDTYYKCTTTGCRCYISRFAEIVRVNGNCLTFSRTGREVHDVPVA